MLQRALALNMVGKAQGLGRLRGLAECRQHVGASIIHDQNHLLAGIVGVGNDP